MTTPAAIANPAPHRRATRAAILAAAREIAAERGWKAATVRAIAARIGYTQPIVYQFFASKDELLLDLVRGGFRELLGGIETARDRADEPAAALVAMADAYLAFAFAAPDLYQVMYGLGGAAFSVEATWREGERIGETMGEVVAACLAATGRKPAHPAIVAEEQVLILWGTLHGLVALAMAGRLAGGAEEARRLGRAATAGAIAAW